MPSKSFYLSYKEEERYKKALNRSNLKTEYEFNRKAILEEVERILDGKKKAKNASA